MYFHGCLLYQAIISTGYWYIWTLLLHIQTFKPVAAVAGVNKSISRMTRPKAPEVPALGQLFKEQFEYVK